MKRLYSIFDNKSKTYGPIFGVPHDAVAVREFGGAVLNEQSGISRYPDDFELHRIGEFRDVEGPVDLVYSAEQAVSIVSVVEPADVVVIITARQFLDSQTKGA